MNKIKLIILSLLMPLTIFGAAQPAAAFNLFGDACKAKTPAASSPACQSATNEGGTNNKVTGPGNVISVAANILALITGIAAVIMIIVSGLTMITSGGNSEAVTASRRRLLAALGGLVLVVLAWAIIRFVTDNLIS